MKNVGDKLEECLENLGINFYPNDRPKCHIYYSIELAVWQPHFRLCALILELWN
jgi:hypothetical protein